LLPGILKLNWKWKNFPDLIFFTKNFFTEQACPVTLIYAKVKISKKLQAYFIPFLISSPLPPPNQIIFKVS